MSKLQSDRSDATDYVEENSLSFQAEPWNLDLGCPQSIVKDVCKNQHWALRDFENG